MPVLSEGTLKIDYTDAGAGPPVILIHSAVSANRQWHALVDVLQDKYQVLAINLFGYGETTPWSETHTQSMDDQAQLVLALCKNLNGPIHLVGHSLGGSVALKAEMLLGERVDKLILFEPNPFHLLQQNDRKTAYQECLSLHRHVKYHGALGDWSTAAERFADYWLGENAWQDMPEKRRSAFATALQPNYYEWDAILGDQTTLEAYQAITAQTLVMSDPNTQRSIREIVDLFIEACPHWRFHYIEKGGHMAPLTHPQLINPIIKAFLDAS